MWMRVGEMNDLMGFDTKVGGEGFRSSAVVAFDEGKEK
jgi:hypothetical protein